MTLHASVQFIRTHRAWSIAVLLLSLPGQLAKGQGGPAIFPAPVFDSGGMNPRSIAIGNVNGDGRLDVVVANSDSNTVCVLASNAAGTLATAVSYPSGGSYPISVAIGDVNGDGRPDVIVANFSSNTVCVLAGNAVGTLDPAVSYPSGGNNPTSVAIGDVNGDGRPDVVVANNFPSNAVCVLAGNAVGTLDAAVSYPSGGDNPTSVAIGDFDGDQRPDVVVVNSGAHTVCILAGNAAGTLNAAVSYPSGGTFPYSVAVGDLNDDGRQDVAVTDINSDSVCVLTQSAAGTLNPPVSHPTGGPFPYSIAIGDLNRDGWPDVIVANAWSYTSTISVLSNSPGGILPAVPYLSGGSGVFSVAIGDVTGDGRLDVVATNTNEPFPYIRSGTVCVLAGTRAGTLNAADSYDSCGSIPSSVALGDVNGDGRPDVVVANGVSNTICVLAGNAGGYLDPAVSYDSGWSSLSSVAIGDVNHDGRPDVVAASASSNMVSVLAGNAVGTLDAAISYPSGGSHPTSIAIGEVNGDGLLDVIVVNDNPGASDTVCVLAGNASGTLEAAVAYPSGGSGPRSVAIGDVNADGRLDVIVANASSGTICVLAGNAIGTLDAAISYPSGGSSPSSVAIGDLNADGRLDVIVADSGSPYVVSVLSGNAAGGLDTAVSYPAGGSSPISVAIGDVNGDGLPDVVVANSYPANTISVLAGTAAGTLAAAASYASDGFAPTSIAIGDLNGDGRPEAVVANGITQGALPVVAVLINQYSGTRLFSFCDGSGVLGHACPCGNGGLPGHGCQNSASTGGAQLSATGTTTPDSVVLTSSGELPSVLSIFLQGNAETSYAAYGDGLRCTGGHLKRLYTRSASGGSVSAPQGSDPSITARSAVLGDPISHGSTRFYQVYYRDPAASFCPPPNGDGWNVSSAIAVSW